MTPEKYLDFLNKTYFKLHKTFEELFWLSYMGDHSVNKRKDTALAKLDGFRADPKYSEEIKKLIQKSTTAESEQWSYDQKETKKRLQTWLHFFEMYQTPKEALAIKEKIDKLESEIHKKLGERKEGYIDPYTKKFVSASGNEMRTIMVTNPDEKIRKACFEAREKGALDLLPEYIKVVGLRNKYARILGYEDFYAYNVEREDGMTKKELFKIFDDIYEKTKYAKKDIIKLEKQMPGLRKPWNFGYMMAGDFTKEEDPYFQFDDALLRWGRSFSALGIDYMKGTLGLDLLERKGKYHNGFCHWPNLVRFEGKKRFPGSSNFTCNAVFGQIGSGADGHRTLFHEGGHAAHMLNSEQKDVCVNHEYLPMSTSWAETQSMFLDTMFGSIEWRTRYAKNAKGESYPLDLYERKVKKLHVMRPLDMNGIIFVAQYEKEIYEAKNLTKEKVLSIAKKNFRKYFERSEDSLNALNIPHIYSWESSAAYHGYGLAELALSQWREYFYKKYGYIVDNPNVGKEMKKVWQLAGSKTYNEFVVLATGKKITSDAFLKNVTATIPQILKSAKKKIARLKKVKPYAKKVNLNADLHMVHGKKEIANNKKSFEDMAEQYKKWLQTQLINKKAKK